MTGLLVTLFLKIGGASTIFAYVLTALYKWVVKKYGTTAWFTHVVPYVGAALAAVMDCWMGGGGIACIMSNLPGILDAAATGGVVAVGAYNLKQWIQFIMDTLAKKKAAPAGFIPPEDRPATPAALPLPPLPVNPAPPQLNG